MASPPLDYFFPPSSANTPFGRGPSAAASTPTLNAATTTASSAEEFKKFQCQQQQFSNESFLFAAPHHDTTAQPCPTLPTINGAAHHLHQQQLVSLPTAPVSLSSNHHRTSPSPGETTVDLASIREMNRLIRVKSLENCRVCGDGPARMHYGVPTCFGCKGFFRRTLKRTKEYTCRYNGSCVVDRYERNSCRYCRFKRCLEVGMDPKAVRPDRDAAGRTHPIRHRRLRNSHGELGVLDEEEAESGGMITDDWIRKMPVEMRTLLMQLMNIDLLVANGDTTELAKNLYPLSFQSLHQILDDPTCLDGKRTELRYESYRQIEASELTALAHRRLIATIDTVDQLCALMDIHSVEDKVLTLVCHYNLCSNLDPNNQIRIRATHNLLLDRCHGEDLKRSEHPLPLQFLLNNSAGYLPRGAHDIYEEPYHFANHLVDRCLDELVEPFRSFNFKDQEAVLMKYIVILNPHLRSLTTEASEQIADFRDRIQETLYNVVRDSHPKEVPSSRFGNLLLFLPNILILGNVMYENLQFIQTFRKQSIGPLLNELLDDNIEPVDIKNVQFDDIMSTSSDDYKIQHSQSTSSISSMASYDWQQNQQHFLDYYTSERRASMSFHDLNNGIFVATTNEKKKNNGMMGFQCQAPMNKQNSDQKLCSSDSDPDYNLTLTADSFRNVHSTMDVPMDGEHQQTTEYQNAQQQRRPQFFIDTAGATLSLQHQQSHFNSAPAQQHLGSTTIMGHGHHVFTVEKANVCQMQQQQHDPQQMMVNGEQPEQPYPFTSRLTTNVIPPSTSIERFQ